MIRNARPCLNGVTHHIPRSSTFSRVLSSAPATVADSPSTSSSLSSSIIRKAELSLGQKHKGKETDSANGDESRKRLLKPHVLSTRLVKLCGEGKLDEALTTLRNMPLDAQNVAVWGTLVHYAGMHGRFQLAYQIYTDMKRRGFKPESRTYVTLFAALNKVPEWEGRTKLLQYAHKTYESYLAYTDLVRSQNPTSPEVNIIPINAYLSILGRAKEWSRLFDVFNNLPDSGPLAPDRVTYTLMFKAFASRSASESGNEQSVQTVRERCASDARLIWRQMAKRIENGAEVDVDSVLISCYVQALTHGRPADQIAAFDVLRDYVGLAKPGETAPKPTVKLAPAMLSDVLYLCNVAKKYRLSVYWAQQLMDSDPSVLDRGHMDHVLAAYGSLAAMGSLTEASSALQTLEWMIDRQASGEHDHRIRPGLSTYTLVLTACWRARDWDSALRTFELMSGYRGSDFTDGAAAPGEPQRAQRPHGRNILPDAAALSFLVRAATASADPANMRQCLRIVHHLGLRRYLSSSGEGGPAPDEETTKRTAPRFKKDAQYYAHKAAQAVVELVEAVVPKKTDESGPLGADERAWITLRSEARSFLIAQRKQRPGPGSTPLLEEDPLGSEAGLASTDDAVRWRRIAREQKLR